MVALNDPSIDANPTSAGSSLPNVKPDIHFSSSDIPPFLRPRRGGIWDECQECANELRRALQAALDKLSVGAEVLMSPDGVYPVVVRCELWIPVPTLSRTRRCFAEIELTPQPQRDLTVQVHSSCSRGGKVWRGPIRDTIPRDLPDAETFADKLVAFFWGNASTPPELFRPRKLAAVAGDLLRRKNNDWQGIKRDSSGGIQMALGALLLIPGVNIVAGVALVVMQLADSFGGGLGRQAVILDSGQPSSRPRQLEYIDSWHVVLPGLAPDRDAVMAEVLGTSYGKVSDVSEFSLESISHRTRYGLETRAQLICSLRRAAVFAHVQAYGADLYVGWDAHVNRAYWHETQVHEGRETYGDRRAIITVPVVAQAVLTEYDIVDINLLSEQVHRSLRTIVERLVHENRIDQEIDFTPLRRNRDDLLGTGTNQASTAGRVTTTIGRIA